MHEAVSYGNEKPIKEGKNQRKDLLAAGKKP